MTTSTWDKNTEDLINATVKGDFDTVKSLVEGGQDVNAPHRFGFTATMYAAQANHVEILDYLIEHGADIHAKSETGWTAITMAEGNGHALVVKILMNAIKTLEDAFKELEKNKDDYMLVISTGSRIISVFYAVEAEGLRRLVRWREERKEKYKDEGKHYTYAIYDKCKYRFR